MGKIRSKKASLINLSWWPEAEYYSGPLVAGVAYYYTGGIK
jgi:hypothetical protein